MTALTFPSLKTGAAIQFDSSRAVRFRTQVSKFVDGSEQRFPQFESPALRWVVRLELLTDGEVQQLIEFHAATRGRMDSFRFVDPWTGIEHDNCRFEADEFGVETTEESRARTQFAITNAPE